MRKIIPLVIKLSAVLMVLSVVGQQVTATKGDVERALELLKQARAAIGGEAAIATVQNLSLNGKSSRSLQTPDRLSKQITGDIELSMILPDKLIRIEKLTSDTSPVNGGSTSAEQKDVVVKDVRVKVVRDVKEAEDTNSARNHDRSEIAYYMLGLLLTPPPSFAVSYNYAGETNLDGSRADIVEVSSASGFMMKLYLDKSSHLPLMMSYKGNLPRLQVEREVEGGGTWIDSENKEVIIIQRKPDGEAGGKTPAIVFERKIDEGEPPNGGHRMIFSGTANEDAEVQVRFLNFRSVGGLLLPHTLTHLVNGNVDAVWTVEKYEINSPSIADKYPSEIHWRSSQN